MMSVACQNVVSTVRSRSDLYLLLVSEDCLFCRTVLENFPGLKLKFDTLIVNVDQCGEELEQFVKYPAVPMMAHFHEGEEVGRAVGLDDIMAFGEEVDEGVDTQDEANDDEADAA